MRRDSREAGNRNSSFKDISFLLGRPEVTKLDVIRYWLKMSEMPAFF
jgi:hypothetical protein